MRTFLQEVAHDLFVKLDGDFSRVAIVFPNKRAGLFFDEYLAKESDHPLWSPVYVSISDLFQQLSPLKLGDPILLICMLYQVFKEQTGSDEKLDSFYPWGQLLISDFDDVDKNLVNPDNLFENLQDLKNEMNDLSFLDKEQEQALQQFFTNFSIEKHTELKQRFSTLWNKLNSIYHAFQAKLNDSDIAYEGMLYRSVINRIKPEEMEYDKYVFVGFNVLNKVENRLFSMLHDADKAMFYWDYDIFYTQTLKEHLCKYEAGEFICHNIQTFGNELGEEYFNHLNNPKKVCFISSSTENAQARYVPQWIHDTLKGEEKENAVVLCNESLLLPVLHSIPDEIKNVNITMGFPLSQTPIYNFIKAAISLQTNGFRKDTGQFLSEEVRLILSHPYTQRISGQAKALLFELTQKNRLYIYPGELGQDDFLKSIFTYHSGNAELCRYLINLVQQIALSYRDKKKTEDLYNQLYRESLYQCYVIVNRLLTLIEKGSLIVETNTWNGLLGNILSMTAIPFHGEPAIGMQVMGVLETRNLDFRNVLIMSLNEGELPKAGSDASFIPYNLRKAFGMTTIEHKNAVFAYYFYRLIQRAEEITLLYNSDSSGLNKGEMSRFMLQFLVEWPHEIKREYLEAGQQPTIHSEIIIEKNTQVTERLIQEFDFEKDKNASLLSPSALNNYIDCPLRFYFQYVGKLKIPKEVTIEVNSPMFGTIFHKAAKLTYKYLASGSNQIQSTHIEQLLKDPIHLRDFVDKAFKEDFFHTPSDEKAEYNGIQLINFRVIETYLKQLLELDKRYTPFNIIEQEKRTSEVWPIETSQERINTQIGGYIDRADFKENTLRIVDYKTGDLPVSMYDIPGLFAREGKRPNYIFQAFLYSVIEHRKDPTQKVKPALLYIHKAANEEYSSDILIGEPRKKKMPIEDIAPYEEEFRSELKDLIDEIFDPKVPFAQTKEKEKCTNCPFLPICKNYSK
jgi:hypothetical protein